jgi:hypothetical protein
MLDLALVLDAEGVEPKNTLVLRHRPSEPGLRRAFAWIAGHRADLFDAYQATHGPRTEAALKQAKYVASFIGHRPGAALLVGIYAVSGFSPVDPASYMAEPPVQELISLGMRTWEDKNRSSAPCRFDLQLLDALKEQKGRLEIGWPPPDRAWYRWGDSRRNRFPVEAIHAESGFAPAMPQWPELVLDWAELHVLPDSWRSTLSQWRGIYFIFDRLDGKSYIGSAYGADNLLGRWRSYAATGHGGNRLLRSRDPANLVFSILQRVSPDLPPEEVIAIESGWKARLHTRAPHGLSVN